MPTYEEIIRRLKLRSPQIGTVITIDGNHGTVLLESGEIVNVRYIEAEE